MGWVGCLVTASFYSSPLTFRTIFGLSSVFGLPVVCYAVFIHAFSVLSGAIGQDCLLDFELSK